MNLENHIDTLECMLMIQTLLLVQVWILTKSLFLCFLLNSVILTTFLVSPSSTSVDEGEALQLFCIHSGSLPAADITWTLNGIAVMTSSRISVQSLELSGTDPPQTSSSLYISSVEPSDMGDYQCEAMNHLLPDTVVTSSEGSVTVIGEALKIAILSISLTYFSIICRYATSSQYHS